jgi:hypothetical protein
LHVYYYVPLHILCEIYSFFSHLTLSEIKIRTDWWINQKNDLPWLIWYPVLSYQV